MPKLTIDGIELEVAPGTSVLQACEQLGIEVPRFCYHDKLSVPANCRMCLVEIEKTPKPVASCAMPCSDGMAVHTDTPMVHKARNGVMEMLLINHPLDCPICDQGGECDLQDQAMGYGFDRSRYMEAKRAVKDKDLGPLVKTVMTRCIQCTRCIRFADEIAGTPELGGLFRSENMEIGTYVNQPLTSELSGNLIDICPVGALTNKPLAFEARSWEYQKTESVDVLDAVGSNIRIDARGNEVMRILPRLNEDVNEEWINDKTRFACDGLKYQRLDTPYLRKNGKLHPVAWAEAFTAIAAKLRETAPGRVAALAGDLADCESLFALKSLMLSLGVPNMDCRQDGAEYDVSSRAGYIMNSGIAGIEDADAILLIGTDPRHEASLVNARIRKRWLRGGCRVGLIGPAIDLSYPYRHIGNDPQAIQDLIAGNHPFAEILHNAKKPMLIVGAGALARPDGAALHAVARGVAEIFEMIREDWNGFNVLQLAASRAGGLDLGFLPQPSGFGTNAILHACEAGKMDMLYLCGADEIDMQRLGNTAGAERSRQNKVFVIYQGHHGDNGAHRADVILPGAAYTEKDATYVNTEGRPQRARRAVFPPGEAREDWKIVRALSQVLGKPLPFDTLAQLREKMVAACPVLGQIGEAPKPEWGAFGRPGELSPEPFAPAIANFYMTDPISRASRTMAKCTAEILPLVDREAAE
ncbi:MAG TPA: NADH-quinone oxidoreductase subunit NuoG [Alphaproteobacteria bacterium]|nr:NADH-quinone oxidoreductase subunit NuoG [Alphaproteobacteria bacterium]